MLISITLQCCNAKVGRYKCKSVAVCMLCAAHIQTCLDLTWSKEMSSCKYVNMNNIKFAISHSLQNLDHIRHGPADAVNARSRFVSRHSQQLFSLKWSFPTARANKKSVYIHKTIHIELSPYYWLLARKLHKSVSWVTQLCLLFYAGVKLGYIKSWFYIIKKLVQYK
jgi:hypothetical protein